MTPTAVTRPVAVPAATDSARGRTPGTGQGEAFAELLAATAAAVPVEDRPRPASRLTPASDQAEPGATDVTEPGTGSAADPDAPVEEPAVDRAEGTDVQIADAPAPMSSQPVPAAAAPGAVGHAPTGEASTPSATTAAAPVGSGTIGAAASAPLATGEVTLAETPLAPVAGPGSPAPEDGTPGGVVGAVASEDTSSPTPGPRPAPQGTAADAAPAEVGVGATGPSADPVEAARPGNGNAAGTPLAPGVPTGEAQPAPPAAQTTGPAVAGPTAQAAATTADPVAGQVFPEVTRMLTRGDGSHRLVLKLAPEALGEVRVVLTVRQGEVHVRLAGGDAARAALAQGAPELHRLLEAAGATSTQISVGDHTTTGRDDRSPAHDGQQWDGRRHTDHRDARTRPGDTPARDGATTGMLLRPADPGTRTGSGVDVTM